LKLELKKKTFFNYQKQIKLLKSFSAASLIAGQKTDFFLHQQ